MKKIFKYGILTATLLLTLIFTTSCGGGHQHTAGDPVRENEIPRSCLADGSYDEVVYCTDCEKEMSRTTVTEQKFDGHNFVGDTCQNCNRSNSSEGVVATLNADGKSYTVDEQDKEFVPNRFQKPFGYCGSEFSDRSMIPKITEKYKNN